MIPRYLHRGDADKQNFRKLRTTIDYFQMQTNLINGGNGREISEQPLLKLIDKHVGLGWSLTHFLSFSENEMTACRFGLQCEIADVEGMMPEFEYYEQDKSWDFAIITIDTQTIRWRKISKGIYEGLYPPSLSTFKKQKGYKIICINVADALDSHEEYIQSIINANHDTEWLILPSTPVVFNNSKTENSAILDGSCIKGIKKYKI